MNTTTMFYVGIDVSKDKSDICIKDENGNDLIQCFKITNIKADFDRLYETIERIRSKTPGNSDVDDMLMQSNNLFWVAWYGPRQNMAKTGRFVDWTTSA